MTQNRKREHVEIVSEEDVDADYRYWDDIVLVHKALPEIDVDEIDSGVEIFGKTLSAPLIISAMTGGFKEARKINENLAKAAAAVGIGMGVGSQRQALADPTLEDTFSVLKEHEIPLVISNVGAPQLIPQPSEKPLDLEDVQRAVTMIDADVLAVHLNFLQEIAQPEGDLKAKGCLKAISAIARVFPILAKETGAGISRDVAIALKKAGVVGIDVGGLGGTSWSAVEFYRAKKVHDQRKQELGKLYWNWGIPTPVSVVWANVGLPVIATGGVQNGLDVARAVALGASCAGMASRLLPAAKESYKAVESELTVIINELRAAMFLTGSSDVEELATREYVVQGNTAGWFKETEVLG
ncbi:MAG: type 2 isopentenyl-diphosphate Delta-isomerase [Candidatus Thermoplasmatota archaeon]|nr:type 2 isopentenyl-diphosphate Delta-isomerase [Candidatus Thermoplasmatota archaeon]